MPCGLPRKFSPLTLWIRLKCRDSGQAVQKNGFFRLSGDAWISNGNCTSSFKFSSVKNPYGPKSRPLHGFQAAEACNHTQRCEGLIFCPVALCPKISLTFSYGDSIMNSGVAICALQYSMPPGIQLNQSIGFFVLHLLAAKGNWVQSPASRSL